MKVAHLDTGRDWRGGQAQVLLLMNGLRARGHESLLLAPPGPLLERARAQGFDVVPWRPRGEWDMTAMWAAARVLKDARPEIVHSHTARAHGVAILPARWARVPFFVSRRVPLPVGRTPWSWIKYRLPVERYLCVSRGVMESLARSGIPIERLALVPSGIELAAAASCEPAARCGTREVRTDLRSLVGAPHEAPVVGTVASLTVEKNHGVLLDAAARVLGGMPDVHFVWIGEGNLRADLERRRDRLGLERRVHLLGFRADARELSRQFTLFALASSFEGIGTSILAAQAEGIPVVATSVGGVPEAIEDGVNGRLVPPGDSGALATALIEALADPELRARWAERARSSVASFGVDAMVERTLDQYRAALERRT